MKHVLSLHAFQNRLLFVLSLLFLCVSVSSQSLPFDKPKIVHGTIRAPATTVLADMDGNGVLDIVAANALSLGGLAGPGGIYELGFEYELRREVPFSNSLVQGLQFVSVLTCADFDGDGFPDAVTLDDNGAVQIHLHGARTDSGVSPSYLRLPKSFVRLSSIGTKQNFDSMRKFACTGIATADFNQDGKLDLALAGQTCRMLSILSYQGLFFMPGDGSGGLGGESPVIPGDIAAFRLVDFDGDGKTDAVGLTRDGALQFARNEGGGRFRVYTHRLARPANPSRLAIADMNGDGRQDFLISGFEKDHAVAVLYYADASALPGNFVELAPLTLFAEYPIDSIVPADFDADGNMDLAMLHTHDWKPAVISIRFGGRQGFSVPALIPLSVPVPFEEITTVLDRLQARDLDGDFHPELVLSSVSRAKPPGIIHEIWPNHCKHQYGVRYRGEATPRMGRRDSSIAAIGEARLGSPSFCLHLNVPSSDPMLGVLIFHAHYRAYQFSGLTLHVFPLFQIPYVTQSFDGHAFARIPLAVPAEARLSDYEFWFQGLTQDPFAGNAFQITGTRALGIRFRPR